MVSSKSLITYVLIALFVFVSCSKDSSGGDISGTITITPILAGDIVDEPVKITAKIDGADTEGSSIEVLVDEKSIYTVQNKSIISLDFDPENYAVGPHKLTVTLTDKNGKIKTNELSFNVHRRLVAINLPENMLNQYTINAVAFASKMDGSLISAKLFTDNDQKVVLSSPEEFDMDDEFMLTFAITDNGSATGMTTHTNLTRNNPGTMNLTKPFRGEEGETKTYPITGFDSDDIITSKNLNEPYNSDYRLQMNTESETFSVTVINDVDGDMNTPEIFYMYGYELDNYQYLTLFPPLADDFVLDKAQFTTEGMEQRSIVLNSSKGFENDSAFMNLFGYWKENDYEINNFHLIENINRAVSSGDQINYNLNTNFYDYRYWITFGNYFAAGIGVPKDSFSIPENTLDFTYANNKVDFEITGTNHIMGRIRLNNGGVFPIYVWDITFNSKSISNVPLPQLPSEMEKSNLLSLYTNNELKITSTELVLYHGITDYNEYIQKVFKDHKDPLKVTEGQELIYKANVPFHDGPIKDFPFQ